MKKSVFFFLIVFCCAFSLRGQDLANPPANLQFLPGGSYIIAMDNTWQTNDNNTPSKRYFNLKSYGLIVHLLNNNVRVKRIIKSGKAKDAPDFTAPSVMIKPTVETVANFRDFKAGPFVIMAPDALNIDIERLIDNYNNNAAGISGITNANYKVKVYKTTTGIYNVDVRYDLVNFVPKACILNDGGNATIHQSFMTLAGIPATNYSVSLNTNLTNSCYTFASEPHNGTPSVSLVNNITTFLQNGGNFLAECDAIASYEALGNFQTTNGLQVANAAATVSFPNADIGFSQFEGIFSIKQGGSVQNWRLAAGSTLKNNTCYVATGTASNPIGASVAKVLPAGSLGGVVFYLGNHSYSSITDYNDINGIRMYMNAFLTPANTSSSLRYQFSVSCGSNNLTVSATSGPNTSYPVSFNLYADNGTNPGAIDGADPVIGSAVITNSGFTANIPLNQYSTTPMLLNITPTSGCYPAMTVSPSSCFFTVLSVSLLSFDAKRKTNTEVDLKWKSSINQEVLHYNLLRQDGEKDWGLIASLNNSEPGNANIDYQYNDQNSYPGTSKYFIECILKDGSIKKTEIRVVQSIVDKFIFFPIPASGGKLTIEGAGISNKKIVVYDVSGRMVQKLESSAKQVFINGLKTGIYWIKVYVEEGGVVQVKKIIVE